ncbi:MAG: hypothetical protein JNK04_04240 [Myxococcales bacterium]|nr:hypothetical protein [Myxococcales bacterium]
MSALVALFPTTALAQAASPLAAFEQKSPNYTGYTGTPPRSLMTEDIGPRREQVPDDAAKPPAESEPPVAFDAAFAIDMPIMIGAQATLEAPYRFLLQGEIGVLPGFSVDAVDSALVGAGAYDSVTSELVRNTLRDSLVVRLSGGWRPFPAHGFEILGGYTLTSLGGSVSARTAVEAATGAALPAEIPDTSILIQSTVHSMHVSLGWRWVVADHFLIRTSLGYLQSVASSSHIEVPEAVAQYPQIAPQVDAANRALDRRLNDVYTTYVKLPVLGLSLGYRF